MSIDQKFVSCVTSPICMKDTHCTGYGKMTGGVPLKELPKCARLQPTRLVPRTEKDRGRPKEVEATFNDDFVELEVHREPMRRTEATDMVRC